MLSRAQLGAGRHSYWIPKGLILVRLTVAMNYHRLGGLQRTDMYLSQYWKLGHQDQNASRFGAW